MHSTLSCALPSRPPSPQAASPPPHARSGQLPSRQSRPCPAPPHTHPHPPTYPHVSCAHPWQYHSP
eukprot:2781780-Rhodomonas_salina.1